MHNTINVNKIFLFNFNPLDTTQKRTKKIDKRFVLFHLMAIYCIMILLSLGNVEFGILKKRGKPGR